MWWWLVVSAWASPTWTDHGGLQAVVDPHPSTVFSVVAHIDAGWRNEPSDVPGTAHLAEHLWFRGEASGDALWYRLRRAGCGVDATTSLKQVRLEVVCPAGATAVLPDVVHALASPFDGVDARHVALEAALVLEEQAERDDPSVWRDTLYERLLEAPGPVLERAQLPRLTPTPDADAVLTWAREAWVPERMAVAVSGAIDEAETRRLVEDAFGAGTAGAPTEDDPETPTWSGAKDLRLAEVEAPTERAYVVYGFHLPTWVPDSPLSGLVVEHMETWLSAFTLKPRLGVVDTGCGVARDEEHPVLLCFVDLEGDDLTPDARRAIWDGLRGAVGKRGAKMLDKRLDGLGDGADRLAASWMSRATLRASSFADAAFHRRPLPTIERVGEAIEASVPKKLDEAVLTWMDASIAARILVRPDGTRPDRYVATPPDALPPTPWAMEDGASPTIASADAAARTLANGLRIVAVSDPDAVLVRAQLEVRGGTAIRPYGLADVAEYLASSPGIGSLSEVGSGELHGAEASMFHADALPKDARKLFDLLAKAAMERETLLGTPLGGWYQDAWTGRLRADAEFGAALPAHRIRRRLAEATTPGHAPSAPLTAERIERWSDVTADVAQAYLARVWQPANAVLSIEGPQATDELLDRAEASFRRWLPIAGMPAEPYRRPEPASAAVPTQVLVVDDAATTAGVILQCRLPDGVSDEVRALARLGLERDLWDRVRHRRGIVYSPVVATSSWPDGTTTLTLGLATGVNLAVAATDEARAAVSDAPAQAATWLPPAKDQLRRTMASGSAVAAAREAVWEGRDPASAMRDRDARIAAVSHTELEAALTRCADTVSWVVTGPQDVLEPALAAQGWAFDVDTAPTEEGG